MNKPNFETPDMTQKNIDKISQLFPNCITETKDKNGKLWSDTIKVQCLNCRKTKEYCNEKVRSKFQGRGIKALRRHWNQEGLRTA